METTDTSATTTDNSGASVPADQLGRMPQFILDHFRSMLWALEEDGKYGLVASSSFYEYTRRSIDELRSIPGQYKPVMTDHHQKRDSDWLTVQ